MISFVCFLAALGTSLSLQRKNNTPPPKLPGILHIPLCKKQCPCVVVGSLCSLTGQAFKERLWLTRAVGIPQSRSNRDSGNSSG